MKRRQRKRNRKKRNRINGVVQKPLKANVINKNNDEEVKDEAKDLAISTLEMIQHKKKKDEHETKKRNSIVFLLCLPFFGVFLVIGMIGNLSKFESLLQKIVFIPIGIIIIWVYVVGCIGINKGYKTYYKMIEWPKLWFRYLVIFDLFLYFLVCIPQKTYILYIENRSTYTIEMGKILSKYLTFKGLLYVYSTIIIFLFSYLIGFTINKIVRKTDAILNKVSEYILKVLNVKPKSSIESRNEIYIGSNYTRMISYLAALVLYLHMNLIDYGVKLKIGYFINERIGGIFSNFNIAYKEAFLTFIIADTFTELLIKNMGALKDGLSGKQLNKL